MPFRRITSRDVASIPQSGFNLIESIYFSPDDQFLTYVRSSHQSLFRQLYGYDLRTDREFVYTNPEENDRSMENNFTQEERLRQEVGVFIFNEEQISLFRSIFYFSFNDN